MHFPLKSFPTSVFLIMTLKSIFFKNQCKTKHSCIYFYAELLQMAQSIPLACTWKVAVWMWSDFQLQFRLQLAW